MYSKIKFMSRSHMMHTNPEADAIVISIASTNMENARIQDGFKDVLFLKFDNNSDLSSRETRFCGNHADEILNFVRKNENDANTIYVNCVMGESRSAAVAQALANYYNIILEQETPYKIKWIFELMGMQAIRTHSSAKK